MPLTLHFREQSGGEPRHIDKPYFRINDIHGMADYISKYPGVDPQRIGGQGAETLSKLSGAPTDAPASWYQDFAPGINTSLKEHLFTDIFGRGVLSYTDREIDTVSMLTALGDVEPMATGHIGMRRHLGVTTPQLKALLDIIVRNMGNRKVEPIRKIVNR